MATTVRQPKPTRKGGPSDASRRTPAWSTGARASPTFTPPTNFNRPTRTVTPSSQDRILQNLAGLTGTTITLATRTGQRYEGVVGSTGGEGDTTGVTLKDVKELTNPGAPLKDTLFIASTNIDTWTSGPADSKPTTNGDSFKTDVDISQKSQTLKHRELQAWKPSADVPEPSVNFQAGNGDDRTFGVGSNGGWDQFAVNEQLYGVKTQFDEELYTTKLDRSAADFKERERKAQRIANEILGGSTSNPHVAEERNQIVDDSGANEEDKYSTVVRGRDAYVPPGARKPGVTSPPISNAAKAVAEIPKVSINGPDGTSLPTQQEQSSTPSNSSKAPSPAPSSTNSTKPPADPLPAFRDFVTNEKQRLTQKRQALVKNEMDKRMADLVKFSQNFKLNKPIPDDLVPILAKDEEKQKAIREKASKDAASAQARSIGSVSAAGPAPGARAPTQSSKAFEGRKATAPSTGIAAKTTTGAPAAAPSANQKPSTASAKPNGATETTAGKKTSSMFIQAIPPFKGSKARVPATASVAQPNGSSQQQAAVQASSAAQPQSAVPLSPTSANRLNVGASPFRPNPMASAFKPGAPSTTGASNGSASSVSPKQSKAETTTAPSTPNPFFGPRIIKKNTPVHVKDDFNPFKHNKVAEATSVAALWPYNGKRYMQMFPPPQHPPQQHSPHMGPPGPPPMPPPTYEEDSAAQAAARNQQQQQYIYYPPYGYPPMMPGMVPPGPPGAYVPNPFMQPMPYPPGMPPPGAMYASPSMGQMPPPQAYMQPPPPGTYPLPNGAGPRPSMPPTPIPGHAHPGYYQQSPQLQHAVPYQMMMPPPGGPNMPPHQYEQGPAPPVQMGGHAYLCVIWAQAVDSVPTGIGRVDVLPSFSSYHFMPGRVRMLGDADVLGLNCLIAGDGLNNAFHVRVGKRCTVAELRAIVCRDAAVRARFPDIGIEGIVLWKVYDVPQILLPPQTSRTNRSRFGEANEPLLLADIFRDSPVHDCLHVLVQRLRQFDVHSSPQETGDALRRSSPSGTQYPGPSWGDGVYTAPIGRPSALALNSEPWTGPPALRSAPVGYLQQRSANTSPNSLAYSKAVGGQASHMASVWGIDGADPSSTQVQHAGSFPRSSTFPSWGLSLSAPRSAASSPGRTTSSTHQEHLEKAIFELVDEDAHDHINASDSQMQTHSPTPVDRIKPYSRGNQAFNSPPITTNLHALTSSPQSLPVSTYNNTPPISPLRSTPSCGSASPVSETVSSSPFLSIWSLPSDITSHTSLIAYLRRLKSIARFHLINMFRTRPAGQQVFWLEFASANEALQVRDFLVVKKTSTGELVECPLVSEEEYLTASELAGEADKWPNPHGLTNIPARPTASVIPRPPHVMNNAQGLPVMSQMQFQKQPPQRPTQDVSALATRTRSLDQPTAHNIPTFHSPERSSGTYSTIPVRSIPSPSPSALPHRLETLPEDAEASESETDEADELCETQASPTDFQSKTPLIGAKSLSSLEENHTTPTRSQQLPRIGRVQRSVSVPTILSARLT